MNFDDKHLLARYADTSSTAIAHRLQAAAAVVPLTQKEIAADLGIAATTLNSQVKRGSPSMAFLSYLYRRWKIDFNFILFGDLSHLPREVEERLLASLAGAKRS